MTTLAKRSSEPDSITAFFPCYNEQDNIRQSYESASAVLRQLGLDYEIILVDDGSSDQTPQIADAIAAADPRVKVIHHPKNLGYGTALRSGFRAATKTLVFFTDADGQFDLNELPPLIPLMKDFDIISCFRLNRQDGWRRAFNAWCWNRLVCFLFRLKVKDINCAFKLYRRSVFEQIELQSMGAMINAEILIKANRFGFIITQIGAHHLPRKIGQPNGAKCSVIFQALRELIKFYKEIIFIDRKKLG
jgi:glycosyltransferase involved in cell wall biosynthesis